MFGDAHPLPGSWRLLGFLLVVAAVALGVWLQSVALALRERETRSRWASNLRDAVNLTGAAALFGAFWFCGIPPPAALLFAGTVMVLLDVARHRGHSPRGRAQLSFATGLLLSLPIAIRPDAALDLANRVAGSLFQ